LDEDKAAKCYVGALKLNPLNEEAGWALSEIYMSKGGVWCGVVWCATVWCCFHSMTGISDVTLRCVAR
jgi:hypothetical protein